MTAYVVIWTNAYDGPDVAIEFTESAARTVYDQWVRYAEKVEDNEPQHVYLFVSDGPNIGTMLESW